jgi:hypothetical protein
MNGNPSIVRGGLTRRAMLSGASVAAIAAALPGLGAPAQDASTNSISRPLSDFLETQGTTVVLFPPVADYVTWFNLPRGEPAALLAGVDYAGLANAVLDDMLGTTFSGEVTEAPLPDGRAQVSVTLVTLNALAWVITFDDDGFLLFGNHAQDVAKGVDAAVGDSYLQTTFVNTAPGAPLPDLAAAILPFLGGSPPEGFELKSINLFATAKGPLHKAFEDLPDGTPGELTVVQICQATSCTAEIVELRSAGQ